MRSLNASVGTIRGEIRDGGSLSLLKHSWFCGETPQGILLGGESTALRGVGKTLPNMPHVETSAKSETSLVLCITDQAKALGRMRWLEV